MPEDKYDKVADELRAQDGVWNEAEYDIIAEQHEIPRGEVEWVHEILRNNNGELDREELESKKKRRRNLKRIRNAGIATGISGF
jgi:hypothetical protein